MNTSVVAQEIIQWQWGLGGGGEVGWGQEIFDYCPESLYPPSDWEAGSVLSHIVHCLTSFPRDGSGE